MRLTLAGTGASIPGRHRRLAAAERRTLAAALDASTQHACVALAIGPSDPMQAWNTAQVCQWLSTTANMAPPVVECARKHEVRPLLGSKPVLLAVPAMPVWQ